MMEIHIIQMRPNAIQIIAMQSIKNKTKSSNVSCSRKSGRKINLSCLCVCFATVRLLRASCNLATGFGCCERSPWLFLLLQLSSWTVYSFEFNFVSDSNENSFHGKRMPERRTYDRICARSIVQSPDHLRDPFAFFSIPVFIVLKSHILLDVRYIVRFNAFASNNGRFKALYNWRTITL